MRNPAKGRTVSVLLAAALSGALAAMMLILSGAVGAQGTRAVALDVDKTVSPRTVRVGDPQVFTVRVANHGSTRAEAVRMRDPLPSKVRFVRAATSRRVPGSCGIEDRVVICRLGTLRPDRAVTVRIHVRPVVAGSYTNRASASFDNSRSLARGASEASDAARAASVPRGR
jgi:uncharacterized repeat protein (TIGR01451 family)